MNKAIANLTLIKAGAGAGKTHRIQHTLAGWVKAGNVQANRILAVTFTNAAASELRQRIRLALLQAGQTRQAAQLHQAAITTIHAFGLDVLHRFAFEQGLSPAPRQLNDSEQQYVLARMLSELDSVAALVDGAERFNYQASGGGDYKSEAQVIQEQILTVVNTLRAIDKGDPAQQQAVLEQAQTILKKQYGETGSAERLNAHLIEAVTNARKVLADQPELQDSWASNKESRLFVKTIVETDLETLGHNWKDWVTLQDIKTRTGVYGTKKKPGDPAHIALVQAVMDAAQQLSRHPGPLQAALENLQLVITSAMDTIDRYQSAKRNSGLVDYTDMVGLAHDMMRNDGWVNELASQFDCLIIDEFQDTNPLQYAMLDRLHQRGVPVFIVGDLKQAIMGFQGADSRLFAGLLEQHKHTADAVQELTDNWRSTPELMQFINAMGTELYGDHYTPLTPRLEITSDLTPVRILHFDRELWLAQPHATSTKPVFTCEGYQLLANHIVSLLQPGARGEGEPMQVIDKHSQQKRPIRASDIAVLARNKTRLKNFARVLREQGVQVQMQEDGFLDCPLVSLMLDALQALNNRNDQFAWAALATSPLLVARPAEALQRLLQSALENLHNEELQPWEKTFRHELKDTLPAACKGVTRQPLALQLRAIARALNLLDRLQHVAAYEQYRANLQRVLQLASQFEQQDEQALLAMGIVGKNAATFAAWLHAMGRDKDSAINQQPLANPVATSAVVLATWHSAKGLEWPVVMVLQAEDVPASRLPSVTVEYSNSNSSEHAGSPDAEALLANSSLQMLTSFADKTTEQKMRAALQVETDSTAKNLYYVALTRAREQLIIPVLEEKPNKDPGKDKPGQMVEAILSVLAKRFPDAIPAAKGEASASDDVVVRFESVTAEKEGVNRRMLACNRNNRCLNLQAASPVGPAAKALTHSVTPSQHVACSTEVPLHQQQEHSEEYQQELAALNAVDQVAAATANAVQQHAYLPACDLDALGYSGPANALGTWMHRVYQAHLQQPVLLDKAMAMPPCSITDTAQQQALHAHLNGFRSALETLCGGIQTLHCEVPVTGLNSRGQVISGVIDLLVEDARNRWWIVDHKTDHEAVSKGYWEQLNAYAHILQQTRTVAGCVLNWTRHGTMSVSEQRPL